MSPHCDRNNTFASKAWFCNTFRSKEVHTGRGISSLTQINDYLSIRSEKTKQKKLTKISDKRICFTARADSGHLESVESSNLFFA